MKRVAILSIMCIAGASFAQELVVNGGFEASATTPTGWTVVNMGGFSGVNTPAGQTPHSGTNYFGMGATSVTDQTVLEQTIATVVGQQYTVSYWGYDLDPASGGGFQVTFGGVVIGARPGASPYQQFSGNVTATSASTVLRTTGWEVNQWIITDDYSVQAVPEPASLAALGLGAVALIRRRRAKK